MSEDKKKQKLNLMWLLRVGIILGVAVFVILGLRSCTQFDINMPDFSHIFEKDPEMGYRDYEIIELIAGESRETKEIKVLEQDLEAEGIYDNTFLNIDWFRKSQKVHMFGTASYTVDLSKIDENDIIVDEETKTITIVIPHSQMDMLEMHYDQTTFDEVDREILGWGEVHFTPEQLNLIQQEMTDTMKEMANEKEFLDKADESASKQVASLYKDLLVELSEDSKIVVVFEHPNIEK